MAVNSPFLLKIYANPQGFYVIHRKSDRLLAIAGSTHPVCIAVSTAIGLQRCVDLDHEETAQLLGLLKAAGQPAASANFPGAGPVTDAKIAAWIGPDPTAAEVFAG